MAFRVVFLDGAAVGPGWGPAEHVNGLTLRWIEAERATLPVVADSPWRVIWLHCRFADAVRQDVAISVRDALGAVVGQGCLPWTGPGLRHTGVVLDRLVPSGRTEIRFEPIQWWCEPSSTRKLSVAVASVSGFTRPGSVARTVTKWCRG